MDEDTLEAGGRGAKTFLLLHGGAHAGWAFEKVAALLVREDHHVVAPDLPGHGLRARFPRSYLERPLDLERFATEPSPLGHLRLQDSADEVAAAITQLTCRMPDRRLILVGHSMAGLILNRVGELVPHLISRLVYLSAWMTADGKSFNDYAFGPEFSTGKLPSILIGDPRVTGALRFDFRSGDAAYRAQTKASFAADVDDLDWEAAANLLTPDTPAALMAERLTMTTDRWGGVPRTYICCTADQAVPVAAQRRFIGEADAATPGNLTDVRELPASHSPFLSQPEQLAQILLTL